MADFFGLGLELITLLFFIRLLVDTSNRIFLAFIPPLASGLSLTISAFSWLLALRSLTGLLSPLVGVLADRLGRRRVMSAALLARGAALVGMTFFAGWWSVIPLLVISLTTSAYLPIQKAYISDQVPYQRRGRALAAVDASFSIAGILGLPLVGWMIETWNWRQPFYFLSAFSFLAALLVALRLPQTGQRSLPTSASPGLWRLTRKPGVYSCVLVSMLQVFAFSLFLTFWALWLSQDFGFGPFKIGLMGTWIGLAELAGVLLASLFVDRIGKRRGSLIGLALTAVLCALLPTLSHTLLWASLGLILAAAVFEFTFSATIPLFAEQAPAARATVFSLVAFGNTIGMGLGPPITTTLLAWRGVGGVALAMVVSTLLAWLLVWKFLRDRADAH